VKGSSVVGLDIGGANLKAANADGVACSEVFEIWRAPGDLHRRLGTIVDRFAPIARLAVTMTAELADCFATKAEGVDFILAQVEQAAGDIPVSVWLTSGRFVAADEARRSPFDAAAANWHALATWAGRLARIGNAILLDIGSTTSDLIPLRDGLPCPVGLTDVGRLVSRELVYTGVRRTPVCCIAPHVPFRGGDVPLAAEWFATMGDAHLLLGNLPEDREDCHTANGKPATHDFACDRLARSICCDRTEVTTEELQEIAAFLADQQRSQLLAAANRVLDGMSGPPKAVIVSGAGEFLAHQVLQSDPRTCSIPVTSLASVLSPAATDAACAYAVAILAFESAASAARRSP